MNRADKMLAVLSDGEWHGRHEIQRRVGFFLTNNAASELRAKCLDVIHRRRGSEDFYRLVLVRCENPISPAQEARVGGSRESGSQSGQETPVPPPGDAAFARSPFTSPASVQRALANEAACLAECQSLVDRGEAEWDEDSERVELSPVSEQVASPTSPSARSGHQLDLFGAVAA